MATTPTVKYFSWSLPKLLVILSHIATQDRFSNGFNGQNHEDVLMSDAAFLNSQQEFMSMNVNKRNLVGISGLYPKLYAHAECLRSQLLQIGRPGALTQLNYRSMGIPGALQSRDINLSEESTVFDHLIAIANKQNEITSDPSRMTFQERQCHDKQGQLLALNILLRRKWSLKEIITTTADNQRKKKAKEAIVLKKVSVARRAAAKKLLGETVIARMEGGQREAACGADEELIDIEDFDDI